MVAGVDAHIRYISRQFDSVRRTAGGKRGQEQTFGMPTGMAAFGDWSEERVANQGIAKDEEGRDTGELR